MLSIAVCDDNKSYRSVVLNVCQNFMDDKGVQAQIDEYASAEQIIASGEHYDLIFLDIEMDGMSGISYKDKLWEDASDTRIIFVTSHKECMCEGFGDNVQGFLIKPIDEKMVEAYLERFYRMWTKKDIVINVGNSQVALKASEILYLKAQGNYVTIVTDRDQYLCNEGISYWEDRLKEYSMYRAHRSYIVNLAKIEKTGKKIIFENGDSVSCAREKVTELKNLRMQYLAEKNRHTIGGSLG